MNCERSRSRSRTDFPVHRTWTTSAMRQASSEEHRGGAWCLALVVFALASVSFRSGKHEAALGKEGVLKTIGEY